MSRAFSVGYNVGFVKMAEMSTRGMLAPLVSTVSPLYGGALGASAPELEGLNRDRATSHLAALAQSGSVVPTLKGMGIGALAGGTLGLLGGAAAGEPAFGGAMGLLQGAGLGAGIGGMAGRYMGARRAFDELASGRGDPDAAVSTLY